ncbi:hypothetical protein FACS1894110_10740 [Spirochaetia bacterium]|nr:hypothetical protein FACS1894110_10740 [Spirochaetia bacterium]
MNTNDKMDEIFREICRLDNVAIVYDEWKPGDIVDWDSMASLELVQSLENEFHISIDFEELLELSDWGKYKILVNNKIGNAK